MALTPQQVNEVYQDFMKEIPGTISVPKNDILTALQAVDDFCEQSLAAAYGAINGAFSDEQKTLMIGMIIQRRIS